MYYFIIVKWIYPYTWCARNLVTVEYGSWVDYILQWEKDFINNPDIPILVVHYEDMKQVSEYL